MAAEWQEVSLGQLFRVKHGFAFKGEFFTDAPHFSTLVTPGNFAIGGGFQDEKRKYYCGPVPHDYVLRPGQIVVTMTDLSKQSDTLGFAARIPHDNNTWLHNQRVGLLEFKTDIPTDPRFVEYLLRTHGYRSWIIGSATGTTVKHTSPSRIESYSTKIPPLHEQLSIASTLGSLDDKIELNHRTNETLEAIARTLFKSWFVDFDPVRAKASGEAIESICRRLHLTPDLLALFPDRLVDSELGEIPEGWDVSSLDKFASLDNKSISPGKQPDTVFEHYSIPAFDANQMPVFEPGISIKSNKYLVSPRAVLVSKLNPETPRIWLPSVQTQHAVCSTEFMQFVLLHEYGRSYLHLLMCSDGMQSEVLKRVTGSTGSRQRAQPSQIAVLPTLLPPKSIIKEFEVLVDPILRRISGSLIEICRLEEVRDTLLPKLLSGELSIHKS